MHPLSGSANWPNNTGCLQSYIILYPNNGSSMHNAVCTLVAPQLKQVKSTSGENLGLRLKVTQGSLRCISKAGAVHQLWIWNPQHHTEVGGTVEGQSCNSATELYTPTVTDDYTTVYFRVSSWVWAKILEQLYRNSQKLYRSSQKRTRLRASANIKRTDTLFHHA